MASCARKEPPGPPKDLPDEYAHLLVRAGELTSGIRDHVANAGNICALIYWSLNDREIALGNSAKYCNWVGIYYTRNDECILGPFQGRTAVVRIPYGKGVCGTTAQAGSTTVVPDVHEFPGHIACDSASESEIVIPIRDASGVMRAILDIDSPTLNRWSDTDVKGLEDLARHLGLSSDWE